MEQPFWKYYGKAFAETSLGQIKWIGTMITALKSKLAKHQDWKGWQFIRSETREKDGKQTTLFIYEEVKP